MNLKIESERLIEYFGTDELTDEFLAGFKPRKRIGLDVYREDNPIEIISEVKKINNSFPNQKGINHITFFLDDGKKVDEILTKLSDSNIESLSFFGHLRGANCLKVNDLKNIKQLDLCNDLDDRINMVPILLPHTIESVSTRNIKLKVPKGLLKDTKGNKQRISLLIDNMSELSLETLEQIEKNYEVDSIRTFS